MIKVLSAKKRDRVRFTILIGIFQKLDDLRIIIELLPLKKVGGLTGPFFMKSGPISHRHDGDIIMKALLHEFPSEADVLHLLTPAMSFGNINGTLGINTKGGGIDHL